MAANNPKNKPLHRVRQIRNAERAAARFPQLADALFTPTDAITRRHEPNPLPMGTPNNGGLRVVAGRFMPPQPTMTQFYHARSADLRPVPFASAAEEMDYHARRGHPGFVTFVRSGTNQYNRMMKAGLDPRKEVPPEELLRRARHEAKVQRMRNQIDEQMILDESRRGVEGRKRESTAPFPMWKEMLARKERQDGQTDKPQQSKESEDSQDGAGDEDEDGMTEDEDSEDLEEDGMSDSESESGQ